MKKAVLCIAKDENQANRIIDRLLSSNFSNEDISILMSDRQGRMTRSPQMEQTNPTYPNKRMEQGERASSMGYEKHSKAPQGATTGAIAGGVLGGTLGLLAGIGSLAIPGLGAFIAAGPIMAALSGSAIGGSLGLITGALVGWDIPTVEAKQYEGKLKQGSILISVHTENDKEVENAKKIFQSEHAEDIAVVSEKKQKARSNY